MGFPRQEHWSGLPLPSSGDLSKSRDQTHLSSLAGGFFTTATAATKSFQSCPTLCDPTDGSPPGSPVPGILQARALEWVAMSFSNAWKWKVKVKSLSHVQLLATPWTAAHQAPPSTGFSRRDLYRWATWKALRTQITHCSWRKGKKGPLSKWRQENIMNPDCYSLPKAGKAGPRPSRPWVPKRS